MIPADEVFLQRVRVFMMRIHPIGSYKFSKELEMWHLGPGIFAFIARYMKQYIGIVSNPETKNNHKIMVDLYSGRNDISHECFDPDIWHNILYTYDDIGFLPGLIQRGMKNIWWTFENVGQAVEVVQRIIVPPFALFDKPRFVNPPMAHVAYFGPNYQ